jgi:hypothetical protein
MVGNRRTVTVPLVLYNFGIDFGFLWKRRKSTVLGGLVVLSWLLMLLQQQRCGGSKFPVSEY